jgi:hypothetical protein
MDTLDILLALVLCALMFIVGWYVGVADERSRVCKAVGGEYVDRTCYQDLKPMDIWTTEK